MRYNIKIFLKNFSYSFSANLLSMGISILTVLLIPKVVGTVSYGYIQLYIFYVGYTSYLSLGVTDGIYIRYGGKNLDELNKSIFANQYWMLNLFLLAICLSGLMLPIYANVEQHKALILFWALFSSVLVVPRSLLTFTLLATNNIKENSLVTIIERVIYFVLVIVLLLLQVQQFKFYVYADIIGKLIASIFIINKHKWILYPSKSLIRQGVMEFKENIMVGIKIVSAGIASMLIIGIIRFSISNAWDVSTFGRVSLSLSVANLLMVFINAVSVVLYPMICNSKIDNLRDLYTMLDNSLRFILYGILIMYFPLKVVLSMWLPQYEDSLNYMALLFPLCLYECKVSLLLNTYLKALRKESKILIVNILMVIISIGMSVITVSIMHNLVLAILTVTILLAIRCILLEYVTQKSLDLKKYEVIVQELVITMVFIACNWLFGGIKGFCVYLIIIIGFFVLKQKEIFVLFKTIKELLKDK